MRGFLRSYGLGAFVPQRPQVNPLEQRCTPAEQDWRDGKVQLIDKTLTKILLDCLRSTADPHVHCGSRFARPVERLVYACGYEVECCAAFHLDGGTRVMGQDEDWSMIRRIVSPPAFPVSVRPFPTKGAEHVPPQNPGSDILKATGGEIIVNPGRAAVLAKQGLLKGASRDQPLVQFRAANAERMVEVLIRTGCVAVEREGEAINANSSHRLLPFGRWQ